MSSTAQTQTPASALPTIDAMPAASLTVALDNAREVSELRFRITSMVLTPTSPVL